ncbi:hypothetical protein IP88_06935 [alpha proteobacterium AAP81b]|nr:hypothetical protein IP88_06935 [alpha proteobacterium AAP81b]
MNTLVPPGPPRRLVIQSIAGFWAFYFAINTLKAMVMDAPDQIDMALRRLVVSLIGVALTFVLYLVLRRRTGTAPPRLVALVFATSVPISLAYGAANYLVFNMIAPSPAMLAEIARYPDPDHGPLLDILGLAVSWYFFVVAWGILYIALAYAERIRAAEREAQRYRLAAQAAELRALRYQVNPHFLFNTLNSLSALVLDGRNADAERMILNLATFFRTSLASDPAGDVPLADEIAMQRLYLDIERVRFPERLRVVIDIPDALATASVPGLILQPLVENAVKHGVARSRRPVTIAISARADAETLTLTVADDGDTPGTAAGAEAAGTGTGVRNVCERLMARFGGAARCAHGPGRDGGYRVDLVMPRRAAPFAALAAE